MTPPSCTVRRSCQASRSDVPGVFALRSATGTAGTDGFGQPANAVRTVMSAAPPSRVPHGAPDSAKARRLARPLTPVCHLCHTLSVASSLRGAEKIFPSHPIAGFGVLFRFGQEFGTERQVSRDRLYPVAADGRMQPSCAPHTIHAARKDRCVQGIRGQLSPYFTGTYAARNFSFCRANILQQRPPNRVSGPLHLVQESAAEVPRCTPRPAHHPSRPATHHPCNVR